MASFNGHFADVKAPFLSVIKVATLVLGCGLPLHAETASAFAIQVRADVALLSAEPTAETWQKTHPDSKLDLAHYETEKDMYEVDFAWLNRWCAASVSHFASQAIRAALFYVPSLPQDTLPSFHAAEDATRAGACRMQAIWYETTAKTSIDALVSDLASSWGSPNGQTTTPHISGSGSWKHIVAWHRNGINIWAAYDAEGKLGGSAQPRLVVYVRRDIPRDPPNLDLGLLPASTSYQIVDAAAAIAAQDQSLTNSVLERSRCLDRIATRESDAVTVNYISKWLKGAAQLPPARKAAALVVADAYVRCAPLGPDRLTPLNAKFTVYCPQDGPSYNGNLLQQAQELDPKGSAGELANLAALGMPCWLKGDQDWPDVAIAKGESLLVERSPDRWTPWIHFAIARAHAAKLSFAYPGGNPEGAMTPLRPAAMNQERRAAIRHFEDFIRTMPRVPEAASAWDERWRLAAGLPPSQLHFGCGCE